MVTQQWPDGPQNEFDRQAEELEAILSIQRGKPDYKALFELTLYHLNAVSGSRNSFSYDINKIFFAENTEMMSLRTPGVEKMHQNGVEFLMKLRKVGISPY
jgi:hypothetical protein